MVRLFFLTADLCIVLKAVPYWSFEMLQNKLHFFSRDIAHVAHTVDAQNGPNCDMVTVSQIL